MSHTHLSGPLHLCTDKEIVGPFGTWHQGSLPTVCVISVNLAALSRCSVETHVAKVWEICYVSREESSLTLSLQQIPYSNHLWQEFILSPPNKTARIHS